MLPNLLPRLTQPEFDRIDDALLAVLEEPDAFEPWLHTFAKMQADRLEKYGLATIWTEQQWGVVQTIEQSQPALARRP